MKKVKRIIGIVLAASLMASFFAGCGNKTESDVAVTKYVADKNLNKPGEFPVCKEKITITVGIPKDPLVTDYDTNLYTKALEEKMNCDIKFKYLPAANAEALQKVELMMSSGGDDLPDVIVNVPLSDSSLMKYAKNGYIVPLNDYYEKSSYYIKNVMEKEKDLRSMITMTDGNIYVVPKYQKIMQNEIGYRMWI